MTIILDGTTGITAPVITTPGASINTNISYTGTLTGGAGVINIGSGQLVKDAAGNLLVGTTSAFGSGKICVNGLIATTTGYACHAGVNAGTSFGNVFNINWTGSNAQLWIDSTNVGTFSLTSDYRIKQKIETQTMPALERVMQLRAVTYELQNYKTMFKADGVAREGFIAHELQAIIPSAVEGEKDVPHQIQSLKLDALVSVLTKAIQELKVIIDAQATRITDLENK